MANPWNFRPSGMGKNGRSRVMAGGWAAGLPLLQDFIAFELQPHFAIEGGDADPEHGGGFFP